MQFGYTYSLRLAAVFPSLKRRKGGLIEYSSPNLLTYPFSPSLTKGGGASPSTCQSNCLLLMVSLLTMVSSNSRFLGRVGRVSLLRSKARGVGRI